LVLFYLFMVHFRAEQSRTILNLLLLEPVGAGHHFVLKKD
jgi:hypothetical protein